MMGWVGPLAASQCQNAGWSEITSEREAIPERERTTLSLAKPRHPNMKRREFITLLGSMAFWPLTARAQHGLRTIGVLITANEEPFLSTFKEFLQRIGYIEGQNVHIEVRSANANLQLLPEFANELVRLKVDIIVAVFTPAAIAAKKATSNIPIIMAQAGDPVGNGLVTSLARPGGNVTGLSGTANETGGKLLDVIRDMLPSLATVAVLSNANDPFTKLFVKQIEAGGRDLAISTQPYVIHSVEDFPAAFAAIEKLRAMVHRKQRGVRAGRSTCSAC